MMPDGVQYVLKKFLGNEGDRYPEYADMIWDWLENQPQCENCMHWKLSPEEGYGCCEMISLAGENDTHLDAYILPDPTNIYTEFITKSTFSCSSFQKERNESGR